MLHGQILIQVQQELQSIQQEHILIHSQLIQLEVETHIM